MITPLQKQDVCPGELVASSDDDVKVQLTQSLEVGSILKLETGDIWMMAEVASCEPAEHGFSADLILLNWINKAELKSLLWEGEGEPVMRDLIRDAVAA